MVRAVSETPWNGGKRCKFAGIGLLAMAAAVPAMAAKKPVKTVTTVDGRPVRKVYIRSAAADTASSVATQLTQDTCLTTVSSVSQADAILDLGISLPSVGGGLPMPNVFAPSAQAQTLGNAKTSPQRSASANCTGKKDGGCTGSSTVEGGDLADQPTLGGFGGGDNHEQLDVSLASPGKTSQELWEPDAHTKRPWTEQLRIAAGCPVCAGKSFHPRHDGTYRDWMAAKCPGVLMSSAQ